MAATVRNVGMRSRRQMHPSSLIFSCLEAHSHRHCILDNVSHSPRRLLAYSRRLFLLFYLLSQIKFHNKYFSAMCVHARAEVFVLFVQRDTVSVILLKPQTDSVVQFVLFLVHGRNMLFVCVYGPQTISVTRPCSIACTVYCNTFLFEKYN